MLFPCLLSSKFTYVVIFLVFHLCWLGAQPGGGILTMEIYHTSRCCTGLDHSSQITICNALYTWYLSLSCSFFLFRLFHYSYSMKSPDHFKNSKELILFSQTQSYWILFRVIQSARSSSHHLLKNKIARTLWIYWVRALVFCHLFKLY